MYSMFQTVLRGHNGIKESSIVHRQECLFQAIFFRRKRIKKNFVPYFQIIFTSRINNSLFIYAIILKIIE